MLPAGRYLVVPTSTGSKFSDWCDDLGPGATRPSDFTRPAAVSVHSTGRMTLTPVAFSPAAYEEAMELPVIHKGTQTNLYSDGSLVLYTLKSGYAGVSFVAKNNDPRVNICLTLDLSKSKNVVSHQRDLAACRVIVPAREAKVMHHLCPKDDTKGWAYSWSCEARHATQAEMADYLAQVAAKTRL